jgi:hypothetical protein
VADGGAVGVFAEAGGSGEEEIFELAEHDYLYIVILVRVNVKTCSGFGLAERMTGRRDRLRKFSAENCGGDVEKRGTAPTYL